MEQGRHDPVAALGGPISRAETMAAEMQFALETITSFRTMKMEGMHDNTRSVRRLGRRADWVNEAMLVLGSELDDSAAVGVQSSVQTRCEVFRGGLYGLFDTVAVALDLCRQAKDEVPKHLQAIRRKVDDARGRMGRELRLERHELLAERDAWNPDRSLNESAELKRTAETSLDRGAVELAAEALQSARDAIALAEQLVVETLAAHEEFEKRYANSRGQAEDAETLQSGGAVVLEFLRGRYAEAALYEEPGNENSATFGSAGRTMQDSVRSMGQSIVAADDAYRSGKIPDARNHLIDAEECHQLVRTLYDGLLQRRDDLAELVDQNTIRMDDALPSLTGMRGALEDPRVCADTLAAFSWLDVLASEGKRVVDAPFGESNPYQAELALNELDGRLHAMETRIGSDREAFADAEQMLAAADSTAADAGRIVHVSKPMVLRTARRSGMEWQNPSFAPLPCTPAGKHWKQAIPTGVN